MNKSMCRLFCDYDEEQKKDSRPKPRHGLARVKKIHKKQKW